MFGSKCKGCQAKDESSERERRLYVEENAYLRTQVETLQKKLFEALSPGITKRVEPVVRLPRPVPPPSSAQAVMAADAAREVEMPSL